MPPFCGEHIPSAPYVSYGLSLILRLFIPLLLLSTVHAGDGSRAVSGSGARRVGEQRGTEWWLRYAHYVRTTTHTPYIQSECH